MSMDLKRESLMRMRPKVIVVGLLAAVGRASRSGHEIGVTGWGPAQQEEDGHVRGNMG